ncbi:MAG: TlpA family protein disulfide reductase [Hyphomicrobiales bacterium]|nr:TlpA family protein disulfide reductase [Hyphomicrobiales bacterium]
MASSKTQIRPAGSVLLALLVTLGSAAATGNDAPNAYLDDAGIEGYRAYSAAADHRAFAIAPGGAWAWVSESLSPETAEAEALTACRQYTEQPCHTYGLDGQVVFDRAAWQASWQLHDDPATATDGTRRGDRFPDLAVTAPDGIETTIAALADRPLLVHFWGSWCPPCQAEFADLQELYDAVGRDGTVRFVLLQGREGIARSSAWMKRFGYQMPLHDSGHQGRVDRSFSLAGGSEIDDRRLATVYPTTYVLDRNGRIVFHRTGPGKDWIAYAPLLRHIAGRKD